MKLKKTKVPIILPVPLSHIPYRNWPYCVHCRQVRMFDWHRCNADLLAKLLTIGVEGK